jgi:hypothetical protein
MLCEMIRRKYVDFSDVPHDQQKIHARLENWAAWCRGSGHPEISPMFRLYRSSQARQAYIHVSVPVDIEDAAVVSNWVVALPESNRHAINWYYINRLSPKRACMVIGCEQKELAQYVLNGRAMMIANNV